MRTLTDNQLDNVIAKIDGIYDEVIGTAGDYDRYHEIAKVAFVCRGYIGIEEEYDATIIDNHCEKRAEEASYDDNVDADLDAYSRRFDCEV